MEKRQIWKDETKCVQDHNSRTEELFSDERFQSVFYSLSVGESITITPEPYPVSIMIYILEGKILLHTKDYEEQLHQNQSFLLSDITTSYIVEGMKFTKLLCITSCEEQKLEGTEAYLDILKKVEEKDIDTYGHGRRVGKFAMRMAREFDPSYDLITLGKAATLHDIGKIHTPSSILLKPGRLTDEEFEIIKKHPIDSYELLKKDSDERIALAALQHHERLDGSGYPYGLKKDDILLDARIIAIADVFDAMTSKRSYHDAREDQIVIAYLEANESAFDQRFVKILKNLIQDGTVDKVRSLLDENEEMNA